MDIWLFTNECFAFCIVFVSRTRLDLSVMSLTKAECKPRTGSGTNKPVHCTVV